MLNSLFYSISRALVTLFILHLLVGCGGGGGSSSTTAQDESANLITGFGWYFENSAPDFYNNGSTCNLGVLVYYGDSITKDDIDSLTVTAPNGVKWLIQSSNINFATTNTGKQYASRKLRYTINPSSFPLAGNWVAEITLKDGKTSSFNQTFHEPGSRDAATHQYLYTKEDWEPSTNTAEYVTALYRFPSQGFAVQYSPDDGGKITTTGFSVVMSSYLASESREFNMYIWLYDSSNTYLGVTTPEYSFIDHSSTSLINEGEISITPASTTSSSNTGNVDLSKVKYIRIVNTDGEQYVPSKYSGFDYRSITSLITVN
jgi:hypothetical protein